MGRLNGRMKRRWAVVLGSFLLAACAGANYNSKISEVQRNALENIDQALSDLDRQNSSTDKGLLYYMEKDRKGN